MACYRYDHYLMPVKCEEPINPGKRSERPCGDEARSYCIDCRRAVCDIHRASRHERHHIEELVP